MRAIVVDDDELMASAMRDGLVRVGFAAEACFGAPEALARLERGGLDLVLLDVQLPGANGIEVCAEIVRRWPSIDVLVMSAHDGVDRAMAAVRAGAHDFLTKPFTVESLARRMPRRPRPELADGAPFDELVGPSPAMQRVRERLPRVAASDASVLITGDSGTGKEIVARGLHRYGRRGDGPFVAVSCAALPEALLESELFGHVRGAFTDARADRAGLFAQAAGGVLLLDELGELPPALQPKLLRALEQRAVRPVGGTTEVPVDVRVIAATQRDLGADVTAGRFRADLYYRLNVLRVALPPLCERGDDVIVLAHQFARRAAAAERKAVRGLSTGAIDRLRAHAWPGNVRELRNWIDHGVAMAAGDLVEAGDLPDAGAGGGDGPHDGGGWPTLSELERRYLDRVLTHVAGNRSAAARLLGIDRRTLMRKLAARR